MRLRLAGITGAMEVQAAPGMLLEHMGKVIQNLPAHALMDTTLRWEVDAEMWERVQRDYRDACEKLQLAAPPFTRFWGVDFRVMS